MASLPGDGLARRQVAEVLVGHLQSLPHVDVPGDGKAGVSRGIEPCEEGFDVVQSGGVQVFLGADSHPIIRVWQRVERLLQVPMGHAVGAVFVGLTAFILDHVALDVQTLLV